MDDEKRDANADLVAQVSLPEGHEEEEIERLTQLLRGMLPSGSVPHGSLYLYRIPATVRYRERGGEALRDDGEWALYKLGYSQHLARRVMDEGRDFDRHGVVKVDLPGTTNLSPFRAALPGKKRRDSFVALGNLRFAEIARANYAGCLAFFHGASTQHEQAVRLALGPSLANDMRCTSPGVPAGSLFKGTGRIKAKDGLRKWLQGTLWGRGAAEAPRGSGWGESELTLVPVRVAEDPGFLACTSAVEAVRWLAEHYPTQRQLHSVSVLLEGHDKRKEPALEFEME